MAALALLPVAAMADEGMWMIHALNEALEKKMQERGLQLSAGEIYNADAPGATVADAIVSLGFYCTASVISDEGLLITNHHCAYSDLAELSNADYNYLEDGYWAFFRKDEIPLKGKQVFFLKRVLDVTDEVAAVSGSLSRRGERFGSRKLSSILERRYAARTGLEASLDVMWAGEKYYLSLYKKYTDIGKNFSDLFEFIAYQVPDDVIVYFLHHTQVGADGKIKAKTVGQMLDNYLTLEGCTDICLLAQTDGSNHYFITQSDGSTTAKSPEGMFDLKIPNDLKMVDTKIREYYGLGGEENRTDNVSDKKES